MFLCYLDGRDRLSRHAFAQRKLVDRFADFRTISTPGLNLQGLAGTVTFTAALPEKLGKVT